MSSVQKNVTAIIAAREISKDLSKRGLKVKGHTNEKFALFLQKVLGVKPRRIKMGKYKGRYKVTLKPKRRTLRK